MITSSGTLTSPEDVPDESRGAPAGPAAADVLTTPTSYRLLVVSAFVTSIICLVAAYFAPRLAISTMFGLFWLAMIILVGASTWVLFVGRFSDRARLVTLTAVSVVTYLPKLFRSYRRPAYLDELLHLGQARLVQQGILMGHNSQDPTVGYFPLYQLLAVAVHDVTRLSLWDSDLLVAGLGHVAIVLGICVLARQVTGSVRIAATAGLLYAIGPSVLFWLSEASYESVGLPLALFTAYACLRVAADGRRRWLWVAAAGMIATTSAQPVSGLFLACFLLIIGLSDSYRDGAYRRFERLPVLLLLGLGSAAVNLVWIAATNWTVIWTYVLPGSSAFTSALSAVAHFADHRSFFQGSGLPAYERYCGEATLVLVPLALIACFVLYRRGSLRQSMSERERVVLRGCFVLGALFVLSYPFDLSPTSVTWVHRSWQLVWVGVCLLFAYLVVRVADGTSVRSAAANHCLKAAVVAFVLVTLVGNTSVNAPASYMFAVPYQLGSGAGLVTSDQLDAASWMRLNAPGAVIASDGDTAVVQWAYGGTLSAPGAFPTWELTFGGARLGSVAQRDVRQYRVGYLIVDKLMYHQTSARGYLYSPTEPHAFHESPVPLAAYERLVTASWIRLVYSNPQIAIFKLLPPAQSEPS
ncbi:MAG: hypothetical protein ABSF89_11140 [Acidimicrobiales bacterium]